MSSGIFSALSGGLAGLERLDTAVHNLANAGTIGFKKSRLSFESVLDDSLQNGPGRGMNFCRSSSRFVDFSQGEIKRTGRSLDLALKGDGFFKVAGGSGFLYTRQGNFRLDPSGNLVTADRGLQVVGENGPVNLPHKNVSIDKQGRITAEGEEVGRITVYEIPDRQNLVQKQDGFWELKQGAGDIPSGEARIFQGGLEQSNADPIRLITDLIETKRSYSAYIKTMKTYGKITEKAGQIGRIG